MKKHLDNYQKKFKKDILYKGVDLLDVRKNWWVELVFFCSK